MPKSVYASALLAASGHTKQAFPGMGPLPVGPAVKAIGAARSTANSPGQGGPATAPVKKPQTPVQQKATAPAAASPEPKREPLRMGEMKVLERDMGLDGYGKNDPNAPSEAPTPLTWKDYLVAAALGGGLGGLGSYLTTGKFMPGLLAGGLAGAGGQHFAGPGNSLYGYINRWLAPQQRRQQFSPNAGLLDGRGRALNANGPDQRIPA